MDMSMSIGTIVRCPYDDKTYAVYMVDESTVRALECIQLDGQWKIPRSEAGEFRGMILEKFVFRTHGALAWVGHCGCWIDGGTWTQSFWLLAHADLSPFEQIGWQDLSGPDGEDFDAEFWGNALPDL